jgi:magnesium chelatase subunit D
VPAGLLADMAAAESARVRAGGAGRAGAMVLTRRRGRPAGVRAGHPRNGLRLNVLATLRAAAPWQRLRTSAASAPRHGVQVRVGDFRVTWFRQRNETVTIFLLDASGSSALHRLAEAKGAIELMLAECYVRRDQVAVLSFRARAAEVVLPPTRSLLRAKRSLASLPGGGATPLASGIDGARLMAEQVMRHGHTPSVVLLTDGQANVSRDGTGGRQQAEADALMAARAVRASGLKCLVIDTAPRPQQQARRIAEAMLARYLPLPYADARTLAMAVQNAG